jgi:MinD-like ATPase involved in chromosome partitioning or flagellar assembly
MEPIGRGQKGGSERRDAGSPDAGPRPLLRLAVALGDPERERALLPALAETGDFVIAERCLAAEQLLACLEAGRVDAALVALGLHRLTEGALGDLARARVPVVLLASAPEGDLAAHYGGTVLPPESDPETVRLALLAALRGEAPGQVPARADPEPPQQLARSSAAPVGILSVIAVASGHGSPGCTTVALNLAAALGAVAKTVLVDADLSGPSVVAYLDADPTRNLYMLAHAEPGTPAEWERAIGQEAQPLSPRSPQGIVICGVPKPEMRSGVSPRFIEELVAHLRGRFRYVILDVGADLLGADSAVNRTALALADQILLVTGPDLVSLWHARTALRLLKGTLTVPAGRVALVVNRHDRRHHHGRSEIEWALGLPAAALIPYDHGAAQRAIGAQRPLVAEWGRASRSLLDLAERVHGARVLLPPEPAISGRVRARGWTPASLLRRLGRGGSSGAGEKGASHGEHPAPVG